MSCYIGHQIVCDANYIRKMLNLAKEITQILHEGHLETHFQFLSSMELYVPQRNQNLPQIEKLKHSSTPHSAASFYSLRLGISTSRSLHSVCLRVISSVLWPFNCLCCLHFFVIMSLSFDFLCKYYELNWFTMYTELIYGCWLLCQLSIYFWSSDELKILGRLITKC